MKETLQLSLRLFLFSLIAALALAATNEITKGPIAQQAIDKANVARVQVLPGGDAYEPQTIANADKYPLISEVCRVIKGGETIGYTYQLTVTGYKGPIALALAVNQSGSVNSLKVNSQSETAGLGSKIADLPFLNQFPGKAASADSIGADVDAITGATVSSKAVISGVTEALRYAQDELHIVPQEGEIVTEASLDAYRDLQQQTGATGIKPISAFGAMGFPEIRQVFSAEYDGQPAYIIDTEQVTVVISRDGVLQAPKNTSHEESISAAMRYFDEHLKGGTAQ